MRASATGASSEGDLRGKPRPVDGIYHCIISHVGTHKADGARMNATVIDFECLAGTVPGQAGKTIQQRYRLADDGSETAEYCQDMSLLFVAAGLLKLGEEKDIDEHELENCQVIVKAKNKGEYCNVESFGRAVYGLNNPEVADVPRSEAAIKIWQENGGQGGGGSSAGGGNGQQGGGSSAATTAAAADLSDI